MQKQQVSHETYDDECGADYLYSSSSSNSTETVSNKITRMLPTAPSRVYEVGPGKTYATVTDAAKAAQSVDLTRCGYLSSGWGDPYYRHEIRVYPKDGGYYEYALPLPAYCTLRGMGTGRDDLSTRIWHDQDNGGVIVSASGRSLVIRDIFLDSTCNNAEHHALRVMPTGNAGQSYFGRSTVILSNVRLGANAPQPGAGKSAMDGRPVGVDLICDRVHFDSPNVPQAFNLSLTLGSWKVAGRAYFYGCSITAAKGWYEDPLLGPSKGRDADGSPGDPAVIGFVDYAGYTTTTSSPDEVWWEQTSDSKWDLGDGAGQPFQGSIVVVKKRIPTSGTTAKVHIDLNVPKPPTTGPAVRLVTPNSVVDDSKETYLAYGGLFDRNIPVDFPFSVSEGMSDLELAVVGPNPTTVASITSLTHPKSSLAQQVTLPAGRIYAVRVSAAKVTTWAKTVKHNFTGSGQMAYATAYTTPNSVASGPRKPQSDLDGQIWQTSAVSPQNSTSVAPRTIWPGHGELWVWVGATDSLTGTGIVSDGSEPVYYLDGYTGGKLPNSMSSFQALPVGQPYPLIEVGV